MNTSSQSKVKITAITANLAALSDLLTTAAKRSAEASKLAQSRECNGAFGAMLDFDSILEEAQALYSAALALHHLERI